MHVLLRCHYHDCTLYLSIPMYEPVYHPRKLAHAAECRKFIIWSVCRHPRGSFKLSGRKKVEFMPCIDFDYAAKMRQFSTLVNASRNVLSRVHDGERERGACTTWWIAWHFEFSAIFALCFFDTAFIFIVPQYTAVAFNVSKKRQKQKRNLRLKYLFDTQNVCLMHMGQESFR